MIGLASLIVLMYLVAFIASAGYYGSMDDAETPKWWGIVFFPLIVVGWLVLVVFVDPMRNR